MNYKQLKKELKADDPSQEEENGDNGALQHYNNTTTEVVVNNSQEQSTNFRQKLDREIEKVVLFFLEQQGEFASNLRSLRETQVKLETSWLERLRGSMDDSSTNDLLHDIRVLTTEYRAIGDELVKFVHFLELNVTGIRKILKKHDKKFTRNKLTHHYLSPYLTGEDSHLHQLYHYEGIAALVTTIRSSLMELNALERTILHQGNGSLVEATEKVLTNYSTLEISGSSYTSEQNHNNDDDYDDWYCEYEPVLEKIEKARRTLHQSKRYIQAMAAHALIFDESSVGEDDDEDESYQRKDRRKKVSKVSSFLNLTSTFLYMTNYYIVAPTSGQYAERLGGSAALSGIFIGMTPVAALVSAVLYSWWANRSYKSALLCASVFSLGGNVLYAVALPCSSLKMAVAGRLLNGFGGARAVNRRYIADAYHRDERTAASAAFVTAGALGMSTGPAIAALVGVFPTEKKIWTAETAPGWIMFGLWGLYLLATMVFFEEPPRVLRPAVKQLELNEKSAMLPEKKEQAEYLDDDSSTRSAPIPLYRNIPVMTTLAIYFVLKLVLECLLSSISAITSFYFDWNSSMAGFYLAILGLLLFPANLCVANLSNQYEDRDIIISSLWMVFLGTIGILCYGSHQSYTVMQYVVFGICLFLSTNILEGVNMSLLSKTVPRSLARGTFNSGLLATEAGTLGRAVGDIFISIVGLISLDYMLNYTFLPVGIFVFVTILITWKVYAYLEPADDDDDDDDD